METDIFKETLEKRLQKAEAEVKRLQEIIKGIKIKAALTYGNKSNRNI